jgi:hypothetical protein
MGGTCEDTRGKGDDTGGSEGPHAGLSGRGGWC